MLNVIDARALSSPAATLPRRRRAWLAARGLYVRRRAAIVLAMGLYLALIHLGALALFWESPYAGLVAFRLGLGSRWMEFDESFKSRLGSLQRRLDALDPGAALFIGDSQLAALDIGALADRSLQLSIPGETARRVVSRMQGYGEALRQARLLVVHVGTNDLRFRPPARLGRTFDRLLALAPPTLPVVVSAILPVDEHAFGDYGNAQVRAANRAIERACAARARCTFVDAGAGLADAEGRLDPRYHVGDGVHLSSDGQRAWRAGLAGALSPWRSF